MSMLQKFLSKAGGARQYGKGERVLEDLAGLLGKGAGYAKGAGQWATKEHPMATGAALGAGGSALLGGGEEPDGDEDAETEEEMSILKKLGLG